MSYHLKGLIFDLDDTLLDTSRSLIPQALKSSFEPLSQHVSFDFQDYLQLYQKHRKNSARTSFFESSFIPSEISQKVSEAFYSYKVPQNVSAMDGAIPLLEEVSQNFYIGLVTMGRTYRQKEKLEFSGLSRFFSDWKLVDGKEFKHKGEAFSLLLQNNQLSPEEVLCIGNRLDHEIYEANRIGCKTCWLQYGEYEHLIPSNPWEQPTHTIRSLYELYSLLIEKYSK